MYKPQHFCGEGYVMGEERGREEGEEKNKGRDV